MVIDQLSVRPLSIEIWKDGKPFAEGTGFAVLHREKYFLVTNKHNVTGRHPETQAPLSKSGVADPDALGVWFHQKQFGSWARKFLSLKINDEHRVWYEHPNFDLGVDVVAVPFPPDSDVQIYDLPLTLQDTELVVGPSEQVSIIGFPKGIASTGKLPIWKTGHIASDPDVDWKEKPLFLIDATTKGGMSGSPVIAKRVSIYQQTLGNNAIGNATKFLGVYSGREIGIGSDIEVGIVWKARVIGEILAAVPYEQAASIEQHTKQHAV